MAVEERGVAVYRCVLFVALLLSVCVVSFAQDNPVPKENVKVAPAHQSLEVWSKIERALRADEKMTTRDLVKSLREAANKRLWRVTGKIVDITEDKHGVVTVRADYCRKPGTTVTALLKWGKSHTSRLSGWRKGDEVSWLEQVTIDHNARTSWCWIEETDKKTKETFPLGARFKKAKPPNPEPPIKTKSLKSLEKWMKNYGARVLHGDWRNAWRTLSRENGTVWKIPATVAQHKGRYMRVAPKGRLRIGVSTDGRTRRYIGESREAVSLEVPAKARQRKQGEEVFVFLRLAAPDSETGLKNRRGDFSFTYELAPEIPKPGK